MIVTAVNRVCVWQSRGQGFKSPQLHRDVSASTRTRTSGVGSDPVADFFQQVWAWILDWWLLLLLIAAVAAVVFTKPTKRRPDDTEPPFGGGWGGAGDGGGGGGG